MGFREIMATHAVPLALCVILLSIMGRANTCAPLHYADLWVDMSGNDTTGNGAFGAPFATIGQALTVAQADSPATTKRFVIHIGTGNWNEDIVLYPWVSLVGVDTETFDTRLNGDVALAEDGSWTPFVDLRVSCSNLIFRGSVYLNFSDTGIESGQGKVYFAACNFNNPPVFCGYNAINQISLSDCFLLMDWR